MLILLIILGIASRRMRLFMAAKIGIREKVKVKSVRVKGLKFEAGSRGLDSARPLGRQKLEAGS
jgi:hypothetical protein